MCACACVCLDAAMASDVGKVAAYNAVRGPSASPGALEALPTLLYKYYNVPGRMGLKMVPAITKTVCFLIVLRLRPILRPS